MSSEIAVSKGLRFLSKGTAFILRFSAAATMFPTPLHNSTTSKSRGRSANSGSASTSIDALRDEKCYSDVSQLACSL